MLIMVKMIVVTQIRYVESSDIISACSFPRVLQASFRAGCAREPSSQKQYAKSDVLSLQRPGSLVEPKDPDI